MPKTYSRPKGHNKRRKSGGITGADVNYMQNPKSGRKPGTPKR